MAGLQTEFSAKGRMTFLLTVKQGREIGPKTFDSIHSKVYHLYATSLT